MTAMAQASAVLLFHPDLPKKENRQRGSSDSIHPQNQGPLLLTTFRLTFLGSAFVSFKKVPRCNPVKTPVWLLW